MADQGEVVLEKTVFPQEIMTAGDEIAIDTDNTLEPETTTIQETLTPQALNYAVEFVAGAQIPSGTKRVFICDGSRLG